MLQVAAIFVGGGLGSLARYGVGLAAAGAFKGPAPVGTFLANLLSCVVLGLALGAGHERLAQTPWLQSAIVIGFCGGFSTFSTFSNETLSLFRDGHLAWGIANVVVSLLFCIVILYLFTRKP